ncbi:hypothetical protein NDU88_010162 [Pleurodeles waltl]|uniref:Uncharacterized protein n=1 Tax=Pleurodeles waltl TaxID=8319 RepID=A0AAV7PXW9_PLEWA|nr:hypothetical protein NDU88_010162 [Pleurodeles waltl]
MLRRPRPFARSTFHVATPPMLVTMHPGVPSSLRDQRPVSASPRTCLSGSLLMHARPDPSGALGGLTPFGISSCAQPFLSSAAASQGAASTQADTYFQYGGCRVPPRAPPVRRASPRPTMWLSNSKGSVFSPSQLQHLCGFTWAPSPVAPWARDLRDSQWASGVEMPQRGKSRGETGPPQAFPHRREDQGALGREGLPPSHSDRSGRHASPGALLRARGIPRSAVVRRTFKPSSGSTRTAAAIGGPGGLLKSSPADHSAF